MKQMLLVVVIKDGMVEKAIHCQSREEQHDRFSDEILNHGEEPQDEHFDEGLYEFENGRTVSMSHAEVLETPASGLRELA